MSCNITLAYLLFNIWCFHFFFHISVKVTYSLLYQVQQSQKKLLLYDMHLRSYNDLFIQVFKNLLVPLPSKLTQEAKYRTYNHGDHRTGALAFTWDLVLSIHQDHELQPYLCA